MPRTFSSALVFGAEITNGEGKKIGQVEDLLVDINSGCVIYAVASFSEETEVSTRYYPLPIQILRKDSTGAGIKLAVSKERLEGAPSFEKRDWQGKNDEALIQQVYNYYGCKFSMKIG